MKGRGSRPVVFGVTGGVGTGKSTVARMFQELGAVVLDADVLAHRLLEPKKLAWRRVVTAFGDRVLNEDQTIDRRRLAEAVFTDEAARRRLEAIIHPQVRRDIRRHLHRLARSRRVKAVALDVPLLFEAGMEDLADVVVVVTAPPEVQRRRLREKFGWTDDELEARMQAQWALPAKAAAADVVVDNGDGVEATRTQVRRIWTSRVARPK